MQTKNIYILLFTIFLLNFSSCVKFESCKGVVLCSSDSECVKTYGEGFVCHDNTIKHRENQGFEITSYDCVATEVSCIEDKCATKNIDCGNGSCILEGGRAVCDCKEDTNYIQYFWDRENNYSVHICLADYPCETSNDCKNTRKFKDEYFEEVNVCSSEGKCVEECMINEDCKSDNEACTSNHRCFDITEDRGYVCPQASYFDVYNQYQCSLYCNDENTCKTGFICNSERKCVPKCLEDSDCIKDKFSSDICNNDLNYCDSK